MSKEITVCAGPISLTMPCSDNQELQYQQAESMMAIVMKEFNDTFQHDEVDIPMDILN